MLDQLFERLSAASSKIESITRKESGRRSKILALTRMNKAAYIWKKDTLDEIIRELEDWQGRFDPSWFLIMTIASPVIDRELQKDQKGSVSVGGNAEQARSAPNATKNALAVASGMRAVVTVSGGQPKPVTLPECILETSGIQHSDARLGRLPGDSKWYIVDSVSCESHSDANALTRDVRQLAAKLSQSDPLAFGLLNCKGVMPVSKRDPPNLHMEPQISELQIIFRIPNGMDTLHSLRNLLLGSASSISLTQRVRIASELAKSISYVHTFNFVHKNVRPESILCFDDASKRRSYTFLVGFDAFRAADGKTELHGDFAWERNIYRHSLRQGDHPAEKYRMQHDIYALGVCLLEIGLWESFVEYAINGQFLQAVAGKWYVDFQAWMGDSAQVPSHLIPWRVKDYLVGLAKDALPARMGEKYSKVVVDCLTCLDGDADINHQRPNRDIGNSSAMATAVQYVEQTVSLLGDISM